MDLQPASQCCAKHFPEGTEPHNPKQRGSATTALPQRDPWEDWDLGHQSPFALPLAEVSSPTRLWEHGQSASSPEQLSSVLLPFVLFKHGGEGVGEEGVSLCIPGGLPILILLSRPPKHWDYRPLTPHPANYQIFRSTRQGTTGIHWA